MNTRQTQLQAFDRLLTIMDELRAQCPWDKKQTMQTLRHLTIEETYELGDAILENDLEEVKKELGDVLLHIVFYAKIGSETKDFDIADVCNNICEKLINRHPHIYGDVEVNNEEDVKRNWENIKLKEGRKSVCQSLKHRHLTSSQKAVVALEVEKRLVQNAHHQQAIRSDLLQTSAKSVRPLHAAQEAGKPVGTNRN